MAQTAKKNYRCEACGQSFSPQGIGPHQRINKHQGKTVIEGFQPAAVLNESGAVQLVDPPPNGRFALNMGAFKTVDDAILLEDGDGGLWLLRRIG